jgi:hypothetical protein
MIPSETINSMGFGNLATTIAYLENTRRAVSKHQQQQQQQQRQQQKTPQKITKSASTESSS